MKISIQPGSVNLEEVKSKLEAKFSAYGFNFRNKNFLVASKSPTVGTNILLRKKKLIVVGNFPTMIGQILFALFVVLLGFIIPLIIYFIVFHSKMKSLENEIGDFLKSEYGIETG